MGIDLCSMEINFNSGESPGPSWRLATLVTESIWHFCCVEVFSAAARLDEEGGVRVEHLPRPWAVSSQHAVHLAQAVQVCDVPGKKSYNSVV